jgi:hypothetical protein
MLNAQSLIDVVNTKLTEPTDGTGRWTDAQILVYLNFAQDEVALAIPDLLRTTNIALTSVSGTSAYTLPSAVGKVYNVLWGGIPLMQKSQDSIQADVLASDTKESWMSTGGTPTYWYIESNTVNFYPAPNTTGTVITLNGELLLTEMTDSASSYPFENVPFLRKAQKVICLLAASDCLLDDGDSNLYVQFKQEARNMINELENEWNQRRTNDSHSIVIERQSESGEFTDYTTPGSY